jgi:hypothetical protein
MNTRWMPLLFGLVPLAADAGGQTYDEITVQVIDVPLYVFSHGRPIRNLTREHAPARNKRGGLYSPE